MRKKEEKEGKEAQKEEGALVRRGPLGLDPWADFFGPGRFASLLDPLLREWSREAGPGSWAPAVDLHEDDSKYAITVELPGAKREDVSVEVRGGVLTIKGEKRSEREEKKENRRWVERSYGSFSRSFTLPEDADADRVEANFKDGVLTVEVPRVAEAKARTVSIRS